MRGGRLLPGFIAVAILLLRAGDCVSLLFASQEAKDCCTRGECSPAKKADPCCEGNTSSSVKTFQPQSKFSIPDEISLASWSVEVILPDLVPRFSRLLPAVAAESPPGAVGRLSLPLLI